MNTVKGRLVLLVGASDNGENDVARFDALKYGDGLSVRQSD